MRDTGMNTTSIPLQHSPIADRTRSRRTSSTGTNRHQNSGELSAEQRNHCSEIEGKELDSIDHPLTTASNISLTTPVACGFLTRGEMLIVVTERLEMIQKETERTMQRSQAIRREMMGVRMKERRRRRLFLLNGF
jgi:hypothetical protein